MAALVAATVFAGALGMQRTPPSATITCAGTARVQLAVWLGDQAGSPADVVSGARERMAAIFQNIGVHVLWREDPREEPQPLIALIVPDARATALKTRDAGALGVTLRREESGGRVYVFYGRAERTAAEHRVDVSLVLGSALAHEAAHAILGGGAHTGSGLMRASWDEQQFRLMRGGLLLFSSSEGEAIRNALRLAATEACTS